MGRLLNPKVLQFLHPKKYHRLSPGALFSFQGLCGAGRLGSRVERGGLPKQIGLTGQTQLLLSACAPGRSRSPSWCYREEGARPWAMGALPAALSTCRCQRVVSQWAGQEAPAAESLCQWKGQSRAMLVFLSLRTGYRIDEFMQSPVSTRTLNRVNGPVQETVSSQETQTQKAVIKNLTLVTTREKKGSNTF